MTLINVLYFLATILTGGTLFAWYNFYLEYIGSCATCNVEAVSVFYSKCFVGALFFTFALIVSVYAISLVK